MSDPDMRWQNDEAAYPETLFSSDEQRGLLA